jgi:Ran GTPase-activating protein (RanGAP) involved in mRNA processing and transport
MFSFKKTPTFIQSRPELNLRGKGIGDGGAEVLARELKGNTTLRKLELHGNGISAAGAAAIAHALKNNSTLTVLSLAENSIGKGTLGIAAIAEALKMNTCLTTLVLSSNKINDDSATLLFESLESNTRLKVLGLYDNNIGPDGADFVASALRVNKSLSTLALGNNNISTGATAIAMALRVNSSLSTLYLGNNKLRFEDVTALSMALQENRTLSELSLDINSVGDDGAVAFAGALASNTTLTSLNLRGNAIGNVGAMAILDSLKDFNTTLKSLDLSSNSDISVDLLSAIKETLQVNAADLRSTFHPVVGTGSRSVGSVSTPRGFSSQVRGLRTVDVASEDTSVTLSGIQSKYNDSQTELNLSGQKLGSEGAKVLSTEVKRNTQLRELRLDSNHIGAGGAVELAVALRESAALQKLVLNANNIGTTGATAILNSLNKNVTLAVLVLRNNGIDERAAVPISSLLRSNRTLVELGLGGNNIGGIGTVAIADELKRNTSLLSLSLGGNNIGDVGASAIASAVVVNTTLTMIGLGRNGISGKGAIFIADALKKNKTLKGIYLQANTIDNEGAAAIAGSLNKHNTVVTMLDLDGNSISPQIVMAIKKSLRDNSARTASPAILMTPEDSKGLPKQRAELDFEILRLRAVLRHCCDSMDDDKWNQGLEAERRIELLQRAVATGKHPTSDELKRNVSTLRRSIQYKIEKESLAAAAPERERLKKLEAELSQELVAEARIRDMMNKDTESESIAAGRRAVLQALQTRDPVEEVGSVPMDYLALITNAWTEKIGSGGFGVVYKGQDPKSGVAVAIKVISSDRLHEIEKQNFKKEIEVRFVSRRLIRVIPQNGSRGF